MLPPNVKCFELKGPWRPGHQVYRHNYQQRWCETDPYWGQTDMSRTRSTALGRSVIPLLVGGGLKPVLRDPNPHPRSWHGSYTSFWHLHRHQMIIKLFTRFTVTYETNCQTSSDQSDMYLPEIYISVTVPNHLRPILKPFLRLSPHMDHCPLYTVYCDHCFYDVWITVQRLLREIQRTTATQAVLVFCYPLHLTLSIYRVRTAFLLDLKSQLFAEYLSCYTVSSCRFHSFGSSLTLTEITQDRRFYTIRDVSYPGWTILRKSLFKPIWRED